MNVYWSVSPNIFEFRGANDTMLDEMERSVHDALCVVRRYNISISPRFVLFSLNYNFIGTGFFRVLESGRLVAGGGAVEAALNVWLEQFATTLVSNLNVENHWDSLKLLKY